jgi:hypothetical protein
MKKLLLVKDKIKDFFRPKLDWTGEFIRDSNIFYDKKQFNYMPINYHFYGRFLLICTIVGTIISLAIIFIVSDILNFCLKGDKITTITGMIIEFLDNTGGIFIIVFMIILILLIIFLVYAVIFGIGRYIILPISNFIMKFAFKPEIIIDTKGDNLYDKTKRMFDYDGKKFENFVDRMQEKGFNLEYYDENGKNYYAFYSGEMWDRISMSKTFIGSLIWLNEITYVGILLKKGIKVDERENWIEKCLCDHQFEMAELLIRNKVKSNLNSDTFYYFKKSLNGFSSKYKKYVISKFEGIAELMNVYEDYEGENIVRQWIKELEIDKDGKIFRD